MSSKFASPGGLRAALGAGAAVAALTLPFASFAAPVPGMVVTRDADTGQLRLPTAAEFKALQDQAALANAGKAAAAAPRTPVLHANGATSMRVGPEATVYSVVTTDAGGKTALHCVTGTDAANAAVKNNAAPANPHNEEQQHDVQ